ncbi:MAG: hypothetical protein ACOYM3_10095, partial [Terrimicrobiaceae bacterium]
MKKADVRRRRRTEGKFMRGDLSGVEATSNAFRPLSAANRFPAAKYLPRAWRYGYSSLVIGHWSLVIGHWSLVIGH